jgi:hypothetical protein
MFSTRTPRVQTSARCQNGACPQGARRSSPTLYGSLTSLTPVDTWATAVLKMSASSPPLAAQKK